MKHKTKIIYIDNKHDMMKDLISEINLNEENVVIVSSLDQAKSISRQIGFSFRLISTRLKIIYKPQQLYGCHAKRIFVYDANSIDMNNYKDYLIDSWTPEGGDLIIYFNQKWTINEI